MNEEIILGDDAQGLPVFPTLEEKEDALNEEFVVVESTGSTRLKSLDAMRGFDMFWIIGGAGFVIALAKALSQLYGWDQQWVDRFALQMTHVEWEGFRFFDFIFPMFVFIMGVAVPYAMGRRVDESVANGNKASLWKLQWKIIWRTAVLILIGLSFTFFQWNPETVRLYTVLWLIGMSYFIGASLMLYVQNWKYRLAVVFAVLIAYHFVMFYLPYPGKGVEMTADNNLASWIDRNLIQTNLYRGTYDPEGTIRVITGGMLCLLGGIVGKRLREFDKPKMRGVGELVLGGLCCLGIGWVWSLAFPMIKDLWSPSFVVWSAGWSMLVLALFYMIMDVWRQVWVGWIFIPIGMNAILIYVSQRYLPWHEVRDFFFSGFVNSMEDELWRNVVITGGLLLVQWLVLWWLYRKKAFLKI